MLLYRILNDCIYRAWLPGDRDQTLTNLENKLASTDFENQLITTLVDVMARGRAEGRPDPPEGFQIYTAGYVQFWNHDDEACDHISWAWWDETYQSFGIFASG